MPLEPPTQYDYPYSGPVIEHRLSSKAIRDICGIDKIACSWPSITSTGPCIMWLPKQVSKLLRRHEEAHCNGWRHD